MKKKIVALCLVVCLLAIAIVGGTLAYFTDTAAKENVFTMGNVAITLTEPNYAGDANNALHVYPGQTYAKDPTITVASGSEACYIVATVTISNREDLHNLYANDTTGVKQDWGLSLAGNAGIVSGGVANYTATPTSDNNMPGTMLSNADADVAFVTYTESRPADTITYTYYFKAPHAAGSTETLFEEVTIPAIIDNNDIDGNLTVTVNAYAIQAVGFTNVYDAYAAYVAQGH